jgi:hypothetical protein
MVHMIKGRGSALRKLMYALALSLIILFIGCAAPAGPAPAVKKFSITKVGWAEENIAAGYWKSGASSSTAYFDFWIYYDGDIKFSDIDYALIEIDSSHSWNIAPNADYFDPGSKCIGGWGRWYDDAHPHRLPVGNLNVKVKLTDGTVASSVLTVPVPGMTTVGSYTAMRTEDYPMAPTGCAEMIKRAMPESGSLIDQDAKTATVRFSVNDARVNNGQVVVCDSDGTIIGYSHFFFDPVSGTLDSGMFPALHFYMDGNANEASLAEGSLTFTGSKSFADIAQFLVCLYDGQQYPRRSDGNIVYDCASRSARATFSGAPVPPPPPPPPVKPIASAGPDSNAALGDTVSLIGASTPYAGASFSWSLATKPLGSGVSVSDPSASVQSFSPDKPGVYVFTLTTSIDGVFSDADEVAVYAYKRRVATLPDNIVAAEYDSVHDRIVVASSAPNRLTLLDPSTGTSEYASLAYAPTCLALDPSCSTAVIGHSGQISAASIKSPSPASVISYQLAANEKAGNDLRSVAVDDSGFAYCIPTRDQWIDLRQVKLSDGSETYIALGLYEGCLCRMRPLGDSIYYMDMETGPADIHRLTISSKPIADNSDVDSMYHGDYPIGGSGLWFNRNGNRLIVGTGSVFSAAGSGSSSVDMIYQGSLYGAVGSVLIKWICEANSAFGAAGKYLYAAIPAPYSYSSIKNEDTRVIFVDSSTFAQDSSLPLPLFIQAGVATRAHGYWDFWRSDGSELYVIVKSDDAVVKSDFDLIVY